jgi:hypothetical protein
MKDRSLSRPSATLRIEGDLLDDLTLIAEGEQTAVKAQLLDFCILEFILAQHA